MYNLRKAGLVVLVWLTAAATLVAGVPHFSCRCPDANVKALSLSIPGTRSSCCCNGACCSGSPDTASGSVTTGQKHSCCLQAQSQPVRSLHSRTSINRAACTKTLVHSEAVAFSQVQKRSLVEVVQGSPLPPQLISGHYLSPTEFASGFQTLSGCSPPRNLITLLQHLLI